MDGFSDLNLFALVARHRNLAAAARELGVTPPAVSKRLAQLERELDSPGDFTVVELGAGRQEMSGAFSRWNYLPVDTDRGALPERFRGVVFSNEFFDALPVELAVFRDGRLREQRVGLEGDDFVWQEGADAPSAVAEFVARYFPEPVEGGWYEANLDALRWVERIAGALESGFVVSIDYGYTREELLAGRHRGTIMTYRQHSASANPYEAPGEQDITAHVNFTALQSVAEQNGIRVEKLLTQSQFLMGIGEANQFGDAFEECKLPQEKAKVALQLKHLVTPAGMGETFHVLVASKGVSAEPITGLSGLKFGRQ